MFVRAMDSSVVHVDIHTFCLNQLLFVHPVLVSHYFLGGPPFGVLFGPDRFPQRRHDSD